MIDIELHDGNMSLSEKVDDKSISICGVIGREVEWALTLYLKNSGNLKDCYNYLINTVYPIQSKITDFDEETVGLQYLRKINKTLDPRLVTAQKCFDALFNDISVPNRFEKEIPIDNTNTVFSGKTRMFPNEVIKEMETRVEFYQEYKDQLSNDGAKDALKVRVFDKNLNISHDKIKNPGISLVYDIMSYLYLIDQFIMKNNVVKYGIDTNVKEGFVKFGNEIKSTEYFEKSKANPSICFDEKIKNELNGINNDVKKEILNYISGTFSRMLVKRYIEKSNYSTNDMLKAGIFSRYEVMILLCNLVITTYRYGIIVDKSLLTFNDTVKDPCAKAIDEIKGVNKIGFNQKQKWLYCLTSAFFSQVNLPDNNLYAPLFIYNDDFKDKRCVVIEFTFNEKHEIKKCVDLRKKDGIIANDKMEIYFQKCNAISRLFSPRGVNEMHPLNGQAISYMLKPDKSDGLSKNGTFMDNRKNINTYVFNSFSKKQLRYTFGNSLNKNVMSYMKSETKNTPYLPISILVGGSLNEVVNNILLTENGFLNTFSTLTDNKVGEFNKAKDHPSARFKMTEFTLRCIWGWGAAFTDTDMFMSMSICDINNNMAEAYSVAPVNLVDGGYRYIRYKTGFTNIALSGWPHKDFTYNYCKGIERKNINMNEMAHMYLLSPQEISVMSVVYQDMSLAPRKVFFPRVSDAFCEVCAGVVDTAVNLTNSKFYDKIYMLVKTDIPILNIFRFDLFTEYLKTFSTINFGNINKNLLTGRLPEGIEKFYTDDNIPMEVFEKDMFEEVK